MLNFNTIAFHMWKYNTNQTSGVVSLITTLSLPQLFKWLMHHEDGFVTQRAASQTFTATLVDELYKLVKADLLMIWVIILLHVCNVSLTQASWYCIDILSHQWRSQVDDFSPTFVTGIATSKLMWGTANWNTSWLMLRYMGVACRNTSWMIPSVGWKAPIPFIGCWHMLYMMYSLCMFV